MLERDKDEQWAEALSLWVDQKAAAYLKAEPGEILVFEDAFYALVTAKNAGFRTVGVYDRFSEDEQEALSRQADIYLRNLIDWKWKERMIL